ncbi:MAG: hypothetical protein ACRD3L_00645 [Terriglobales bacterium]
MKRSLIIGSFIIALVCILAGIGVAQDAQTARPMFAVLPPHSYQAPALNAPPVTPLTQWTYTFTYNGSTYNDVFVGTDPSKNNSATNFTWGLIPIKMVYGANNGNMTFDPNAVYVSNKSAVQMILLSPQFQSEVDFVQGGTDVGKTQYGDAYQRANFWNNVMTNTNYHILFKKAVVAPTQTITVTQAQGKVIPNPWSGIPTGTMDINAFDTQLQSIMHKFPQITPNVFPLFLTYNVYLTSGGCCIGGYHSATVGPPNGQTYAYTTTISQAPVPVFSQDISALSHEVGEWILDPFTTNRSPCGIMENGDPLETENNFGDFPYKVSGFTFHPQDLVFVDYFGAPVGQVNGWHTFQNETNANGVCSRGSN